MAGFVITFGICYGIVFVIFLAIGLWKYGYEEKGIWGAIREVGALIFTGIAILSGVICIGFTAFFLCCGGIVLFAETDESFVHWTIGFLICAIIFCVITFVSYELIKLCDIDYKKEEKGKIEDEKLLHITKQEEENIKDFVGGWYYWDRMNNKTKNQYIKEYRKNGTVVLSK